MAIVSKTNIDGVDIVIEALQQRFYAQLLGFWDVSAIYTMYPRANKNNEGNQIKPEISIDNKDFLETLYGDIDSVNSFFLRSDTNVFSDDTKQIKSTVSIIFQADLDALYGDAERVDEVFNSDVLRVLKKENKYIIGDITYVIGIDNVYNELSLSGEFKDQIKHSDIGKRHVVKYSFEVLYNLDCSKAVVPVCVPALINVNGDAMTLAQAGTTVDITIVDGNDDPQGVETPPGSFKYVVLTGSGVAAINVSSRFKTGATTSYQTNDDGDLEQGNGVDFYTLSHNNKYGNTDRFTDDTGGQTYTSGIIVDHNAEDQVNGTILCYYQTFESAQTLTVHISAQPFTKATFSNWYMCNYKQLFNVFNVEIFRNYLNYAPFNQNVVGTATRVWTSTRESATVGITYAGSSFIVAGQGAPSQTLLCRTFTLAELGL